VPRADAAAPASGTGAGSLGNEFSHSAARQGGNPSGRTQDPDDSEPEFTTAPPHGWARAGLDITA